MRMLTGIIAAVLLSLPALAAAGDARQLIANGGFDAVDAAGAPEGWQLGAGASCETAPASRFLRLQVGEPGKMVSLYRAVPVAGIDALEFSFRARWKDVKRGDNAWYDARIMLDFKKADGTTVGPGPAHPYFTGSSDGWQLRTIRFRVPEGAKILAIMPCLFMAKAGTFDLDDLSLTAIDPALLADRAAPAARGGEAAAVTVDAGGRPPPPLHVAGSKLLRPDGSEAWLQGVSVDSLQWSNTGESIVPAVVAAIEQWKANVVRLPMRENRWFGQAEGQGDNGAAYRAVIAQAVKAASSRGAYLIIDLHRFRAPMAGDAAFWKDCAETWKDDPAVIFELFNEPHDIPWEVWRNGGDLDGKRARTGVVAEDAEALKAERCVGMQALVEAVRGTGARNLILAGGLDYAFDISGVLKGFALEDRTGNGIAYVSHVYPWKSRWQEKFLDVVEHYPVVMTEVGCDAVRYSFIPPERHEDPYTWAPDMIACIQKHRIHWTAFSFHPHCGPPMLLDRDGWVPTPFWGGFVKAALLGARFQSDRLR